MIAIPNSVDYHFNKRISHTLNSQLLHVQMYIATSDDTVLPVSWGLARVGEKSTGSKWHPQARPSSYKKAQD